MLIYDIIVTPYYVIYFNIMINISMFCLLLEAWTSHVGQTFILPLKYTSACNHFAISASKYDSNVLFYHQRWCCSQSQTPLCSACVGCLRKFCWHVPPSFLQRSLQSNCNQITLVKWSYVFSHPKKTRMCEISVAFNLFSWFNMLLC